MSRDNHTGQSAGPTCPGFDPELLRRDRRIGFYFRYGLRAADFRPIKKAGRAIGCFVAKPLYGRLTAEGRVDRSAGFNGRVAIVFVPRAAAGPGQARLLFTRVPPSCVRGPTGRRNWPLIRRAAEAAVLRTVRAPRYATTRGRNADRAH